jgi:hypothetical protein
MGWKACPWHMESRVFQFPGVHGRSRSLAPLSRRRLMRQAHGSPALALSASLLFPLRNICSRTWNADKLCTSKAPLPLSFIANPWEFARHTGTPQERVILDIV